MNPSPSRRRFLRNSSLLAGGWKLAAHPLLAAELPINDPIAPLQIAWTGNLPWDRVVDIRAMEGSGKYWDARLRKAQSLLAEKGGVIFFSAGDYAFEDFIRLGRGIVLRGVAPPGSRSAHAQDFKPPARIQFPKYIPSFKGEGTPIDSAFKGIVLENPETADNCGIVHLSIDRGHIHFDEGEGHRCGSNRFVFGCVLTNAAVADPGVPDLSKGQHAWQRFTARHHAAIDVKARENALVANNRLPESGEENFAMDGYVLEGRRGERVSLAVVFDYDNRPGIYVNHFCIGGSGGSGNDGTPESHPHGFRKGLVIRDNFVYNTGRMAIGFAGDDTLCADNLIRFKDEVFRPTTTGLKITTGSSTNDNRAIEARGWRWVIENNDYLVHRNICADGNYRINDGEGIMHEDHCNSAIRDSRLTRNRGNSYLSLYKCGPIDGLIIEENDISVPGDIADIYVVANRNSGPQPCRGVTIRNNLTRSNGIHIAGEPAADNLVVDNRHLGDGGRIRNEAHARLEGNSGYEIP